MTTLDALRALLAIPPEVRDDRRATYRWIYREPSEKVRLKILPREWWANDRQRVRTA